MFLLLSGIGSTGVDLTRAEIFVKNLDTGVETRVTNNVYQDYNPNLSPDAGEVVYWSHRGDGYRLFISSTDGTNERAITDASDGAAFDPEWSHDGTMIAYTLVDPGDERADLYVGILNAQRDGFSATFRASDLHETAFEFDPAWSSNDLKIAFSVYDGPGAWDSADGGGHSSNVDHWKIYSVDIDKAGQTFSNLTLVRTSSGDFLDWLPIWGDGDSRVLVAHTCAEDREHLYLSRSHLAEITDLGTGDLSTISGSEEFRWFDRVRVGADEFIVANAFRNQSNPLSGEIYKITNRSNMTEVVEDGFYPECVDISADGARIVYSKIVD